MRVFAFIGLVPAVLAADRAEAKEETKPWVITDDIHGVISFPTVFEIIAEDPIFDRLKQVGQLGPVRWIVASASHNRYEHSIGVAHLAMKLVDNLLHTRAFTMQHLIVGLAGLLHDVGHVAFSHLYEDVVAAHGKEKLASQEFDEEQASMYTGFKHEYAS